MKTLYKYQQELVDRADKSTALFWDMGLGKTITSLEVYKKFDLDNLFVISPKSMVDEWVSEFESQVGGKAIDFHKLRRLAKRENKSYEQYLWSHEIECVVMNYEMTWRVDDYSWLNSRSMIITDESHRFKNPSTRVGKHMKFLKVKTEYKLCLTGTPQSQGYIDYYNQLFFLDKIDMTFAEFKKRYCVYKLQEFRGVKVNELVGYKNVDEFEERYISQCELLKVERVYDDVVKYNYVKLPTTREYKRVVKDRVIYYDNEDNVVLDREEIRNSMLGKDTSITGYQMLDNPGAYRFGIRMLLDNKHKHEWLRDFLMDYEERVVIFYNYNHEYESLLKICERLGRPVGSYNGGLKNLEVFKEHSNGVALVNYKSGSYGINDLVASNIFIAYSPTDSYMEWEQSKKRIDRDGQKNTPIYYFLESGLESNIYKSLQGGKNFDDRVFVEEMMKNLI